MPALRIPAQILAWLTLVAMALGYLWIAGTGLLSEHLTGMASGGSPLSLETRRVLLEKALALNPSNGDAWWYLANLEMDALDLDAAERAIEEALTTYTRHQAYRLHAQILWTRSLTDAGVRFEALAAFDRALALNPRDTEALNNATRLALQNRNPERARRYLDQADNFNINPRDPRAQNTETLLLRSEITEWEGDYNSARHLLSEVLRLDPENDDAAFRLAKIQIEHFGIRDWSYHLLREHFEPTHWPAYLALTAELAAEQRDLEMLLQLFSAIISRQAALQGGEPELIAILGTVAQGMVETGRERQDLESLFQILRTMHENHDLLSEHTADHRQVIQEFIAQASRIEPEESELPQMLEILRMTLYHRRTADEVTPVLDSAINQIAQRILTVGLRRGNQSVLLRATSVLLSDLSLRDASDPVAGEALRIYLRSLTFRSLRADEPGIPLAALRLLDRALGGEEFDRTTLSEIAAETARAIVEWALRSASPAVRNYVHLSISRLRSLELNPEMDELLESLQRAPTP